MRSAFIMTAKDHMVHLDFKLINNDLNKEYEVWCIDFNIELKDELIGILKISDQEFSYSPLLYGEGFCPPVLFSEFSGDYEKVGDTCTEKGYFNASWSYAIYKKAIKIIDH